MTRSTEATNQEFDGENDKLSRACNVLLNGVNGSGKDAMKMFDEDYVAEVFRVLESGMPIHRLSKPDQNYKRPIKFVMNKVEENQQVMESLKKLKTRKVSGLSMLVMTKR